MDPPAPGPFGLLFNLGGVFRWPAYAEGFSTFTTAFLVIVFVVALLSLGNAPPPVDQHRRVAQ